MIWAIDVGNTHTVVGRWTGSKWLHPWRVKTDPTTTEDDLAATFQSLGTIEQVDMHADGVIIGSVVPAFNPILAHFARKWLHQEPIFLRTGAEVGLEIRYEPAHAVGADRIANALAALAHYEPPIIAIDFGTATTFDAIGKDRSYLGGAILPGVMISLESLFQRTAKLPQIELMKPNQAVGRTTPEAIQSGTVLGYLGAIERLIAAFLNELGNDSKVIATGGLGKFFSDELPQIQHYDEMLTLDGLLLAYKILSR